MENTGQNSLVEPIWKGVCVVQADVGSLDGNKLCLGGLSKIMSIKF